ncbi:RNA-guided endonuclease TnpB family protein [Thiomonas sp. FB-Cd]|uniref:RNA-guided endonuclease InsQ/TnpB family protein n=1 Tax=Thiomonas sp. FB-Cd TaxID=1158292 RepID=UPI000689327B|nr:RNA-guided endonuclease TnpB family protein [Thiomonas sp. FB-Cd]
MLLKQDAERVWLNEVSSVALQQSLRHLDKGFANFFAGRAKYPRFKSKRDSVQAASYMANGFTLRDGNLTLAKHDAPLDVRWSRPLPEDVKPTSVTVTRNAAGHYHVSILVDVDVLPLPVTEKVVGIDMGLAHLAVTSDRQAIDNPRHLARKLARIQRWQRKLARKREAAKASMGLKGKSDPKGTRIPRSNNAWKVARRIARIHASVRDARRDHLHKVSTKLIRENQAICVEDLAVSNMVKNPNLARAIQDAGWRELRSMLEYKAALYARAFEVVNRWLPTSRRCSCCDYTLESLPLSTRSWTCPGCGAEHDRDVNAARNMLAAGMAQLHSTAGLAGIHACQVPKGAT